MSRARSGLVGLLAALSTFGCARREARELVSRAELGVFYGGQVQERREVSVPKDRPRPTLGFRLTFAETLREPLPVRWEVDMPGPAERRVSRVAEASVPAGQARFDQVIELPPNASFGTWNVRVETESRLVVDRAFSLVP